MTSIKRPPRILSYMVIVGFLGMHVNIIVGCLVVPWYVWVLSDFIFHGTKSKRAKLIAKTFLPCDWQIKGNDLFVLFKKDKVNQYTHFHIDEDLKFKHEISEKLKNIILDLKSMITLINSDFIFKVNIIHLNKQKYEAELWIGQICFTLNLKEQYNFMKFKRVLDVECYETDEMDCDQNILLTEEDIKNKIIEQVVWFNEL